MTAALAYTAGFVDGEGCFMIAKNGSVQLLITNTSLATLKFIQDTLQVGSIRNRKQKVNKNQFVYSVYGDSCINASQLILPYLIDKKEQASLLIEFRKECRPVRYEGVSGAFRNSKFECYREELSKMKKKESYND